MDSENPPLKIIEKSEPLSLEEELYLELFDIVKVSLTGEINKSRIEQIISKVIGIFSQDPFNRLLLFSYTVSKENYIIAHIVNNVILAVSFTSSLNLKSEDLMDIGLCAFAHDFGMIEYTSFFQKGHELTEEENRLIQEHPLKSAEKFKGIFSEKITSGILDIHEHINGSGYPYGKKDQEVSYLAKLIAVCDVFEALTHPRNFRQEYNPYEAIKVIIKNTDKVFDRRVVKRFLEFMSIYPLGSLVYLNTGETAIVIGSNVGFPTRSVARVLLTANRELEKSLKIINLLEDNMLYISGILERNQEKEVLDLLKPRGSFNL